MLFSIGKRAAPGDVVDLFLACHTRIRTFTRLASTVAEQRALPEAEVLEACQRYERYFRQALPLHVQDEELSLTPRLAGRAPDLDAALADMHAQHEAHAPLLAELLTATEAVRSAPLAPEPRDRLGEAAAKLALEFDAHLSLEERIVFPAVRALLPAAVQQQIMAELRERRQAGG